MKKNTIFILNEPIKLGQILKLIGLINSGSESRTFLINNNVYINKIKEVKRGRKIYSFDVIEINDEEYLIEKK
ncbi:MAG: RNA-binding S4 domain-containing protein [Mycoplasmoidaceae bacterium]